MRRNEKEIKDKEIIKEILIKSNICRIALHDEEFPYIIPMNFGYSKNTLYFHCAKEGKKIDLIKKNNKVGFEIEQSHEILKDERSCKWTTKYRSIIGFGKITIINDFNEKVKGLDILKLKIGRLTAKQSGKY